MKKIKEEGKQKSFSFLFFLSPHSEQKIFTFEKISLRPKPPNI